METIVIPRSNYEFYVKLHRNTPNSKILYHFASKSLVLCQKDYFLQRAVEVPALDNASTIICFVKNKSIKIIIKDNYESE